MVWIWLGVFLFTLIIEGVSQDLIAIWFSLGALISLAFSAIPGIPWHVEVVVFAVVSLVVMIFTRPLAKRILLNATRYTNIDEYVGKSSCDAGDFEISTGRSEIKRNHLSSEFTGRRNREHSQRRNCRNRYV